jgi:hypothetical protein
MDADIEHAVEEIERRFGVADRFAHFAPPDREASIAALMSDARRRMRPFPIRYDGIEPALMALRKTCGFRLKRAHASAIVKRGSFCSNAPLLEVLDTE